MSDFRHELPQWSKKGASLVTEADIAVEDKPRAGLAAERLHDAVLGRRAWPELNSSYKGRRPSQSHRIGRNDNRTPIRRGGFQISQRAVSPGSRSRHRTVDGVRPWVGRTQYIVGRHRRVLFRPLESS